MARAFPDPGNARVVVGGDNGRMESSVPTAFQSRVSGAAAAALVADFGRHPGPKHGLVVGAAPDSPVLSAAIDALAPDDSLTVVAGAATEQVRTQVRLAGAWVEDRVRVVEMLADADPADAVILAELASGGAEETKGDLEVLGKLLTAGAVVSVAVAAAPFLAGGAGEELDRQSTLFGVGSDLVVRNLPPVRVHRLRYTEASAALASRSAPLARTSSVPLTARMHIDSNGVAAAAICLGAAALLRRTTSKLWLLPALAAAPVAAFFRDPERDVPGDRVVGGRGERRQGARGRAGP